LLRGIALAERTSPVYRLDAHARSGVADAGIVPTGRGLESRHAVERTCNGHNRPRVDQSGGVGIMDPMKYVSWPVGYPPPSVAM